MFDAKSFGKAVRAARAKRGWSLDEAVFQLRQRGAKISREYVRQLEAGIAATPRVDLANAIGDVLGVNAAAFLLAENVPANGTHAQ